MSKKIYWMSLMTILAMVTACAPAALEETIEQPNEPAEDALQPVAEQESVQDNENDDAETEVAQPVPAESDPIDESLAKLPAIAPAGNAGGGVGGGGVAESAVIDQGGVADSMMIDPFNMFAESEFVVGVPFPASPGGQVVIERTRSGMTAEMAQEIAAQFGFPTQIFQEQIPAERLEDVPMGADGNFLNAPYFSFKDGSQLVMMPGTVWINYSTEDFDLAANGDTMPEEVLIANAEAFLAANPVLDVGYTLEADPYGSVRAIPQYEGVQTNMPLMNFFYAPNKEGVAQLQSLYVDLYSDVRTVDSYPVISAENAWQNIQAGLADGTTRWYFSSPPILVEPDLPVEADLDRRFWNAEWERGDQPVNLYGYPTVFHPVGEDGQPVILLNNVRVEGPIDLAIAIANGTEGIFKFTGEFYETDSGDTNFAAASVVPIPYEEQLFLQGVVVREGDAVFVDSSDNGRVLINDAPADLPDGLEVFLNGFRNGESADGALAVDWQFIETLVAYDTFPVSEPIPVDGAMLDESSFGTIEIVSIELGYGISFPQIDETSDSFQPIMSDYLIPVWKFVGKTASGQELTFEIPAVDEGYFQ